MTSSFNHFQQIADSIRPACSQVVSKTALDCQANIQSFIRANGQVDTGFMIGSVYARPGADDLTWNFGVGASYAIYQNYGTRYLAARPFWEPGIEAVRPGFEAAMGAIAQAMEQAAQ